MKLDEAKDLEASFQGVIEPRSPAASGGSTPVLVPTSNQDVIRALKLARASNRKVFVQSGRGVAPRGPVLEGPGGPAPTAIVSMEAFGGANVDAGVVHAGSATTTAELADAIADGDVFLPLGDDPSRSLVSSLLDPSEPFPRSAPGASLRRLLATAQVIPVEGVGAGYAKKLQPEAVRPFLDGERVGVLTRITLEAPSAAPDESERWLHVRTAPYEREGFARICDRLLGSGGVPGAVDVAIRVTAAAYGMKIVVVRAMGRRAADGPSTERALAEAFPSTTPGDAERTEGPGSSVARWVACGPTVPDADEGAVRFGPAESASFDAARAELLDAIDFANGVDEDGHDRSPGVDAWVEIRLQAGARIQTTAYLVHDGAPRELVTEARARFARAIPLAAPPVGATAGDVLRGVDVLAHRPTVEGFRFALEAPPIIPGFKGPVHPRSTARGYRDAAKQYARSSYDAATVQARMTPAFVAFPIDADDVVAAVGFAAQASLAVVARSGGHQYCGLSSGGADTLVLDLSFMRGLAFSPDGARVTVGPGIRLRDLSKALRGAHVAIPHGECPLVGIGGHVQTGGVGHQLRTLGLTLDHVASFKMVTWGPPCAERTFTRPAAAQPAVGAPVTNDDVFRAVLGGGPGSWGVLTEITFEVRRDGDFPDSRSFYGAYWYDKEAFAIAMQHLGGWAKSQHAGNLPKGADLFLSVVSGDFPRPPALLVEAMSTDAAGHALTSAAVEAVDKARFPISKRRGPAKISEIADDGVRAIGAFGLPKSGREFDLPYKKSLYISRVPFTPAFEQAFVKLVDDVERASGLRVVVQAVVGGGAFAASGAGTTHMQRRDALVQLVFDVFYEDGEEAAAWAFQARMRGLLAAYSGGDDLRMMWGTYEQQGTAQLDMSQPAVQALYYDSANAHARLREIKRAVDPTDVFRTSFTVTP
ncbi:MAG: FAD-binding protein [Sandaracinaceae bacterium]|nr:FAD-binding protein [Sandaracinaceae bacterium]